MKRKPDFWKYALTALAILAFTALVTGLTVDFLMPPESQAVSFLIGLLFGMLGGLFALLILIEGVE